MRSTASDRLLFILPGPICTMADLGRYEGLSESFEGDVITTAWPDLRDGFHGVTVGRFRVHCLGYRGGARGNLAFLAACLRFSRQARRVGHRYGLVVTYDPLKTGLFGWRMARTLGAAFAPEVNGVYTDPVVFADGVSAGRAWLKSRLFVALERFVLRRADGIKTLFSAQLDPFPEVVKLKLVRSFPDYVDVDRFLSLPDSHLPVILFAGFPFRLKGVDVLIEAFRRVSPRHPEWSLKILGWYPDLGQLRAHMADHPRIVHHPPVVREEMPAQIRDCQIFVLPSRSEAMGRVLVESMAAGKARVGSRVGGIPTVIEDGLDGLLCQPGDAADLAAKLDGLMSDPELRVRLGQAGRRRAAREFSVGVYMDQLTRFYRDVMSRRGDSV